MKKQSGAALVEFAGVALVFLMIVFGIVEFARAFFIYNTLIEATRRGARVAAICPPTSTGISAVKDVVLFEAGGSDSNSGFLGLEASDVHVYYCADSDDLQDPADDCDATDPDLINFVNVSIDYGDIGLIIPGINLLFPIPEFSTSLPAESLGRQTPENPLLPENRRCFN
jgi:hypothetical protein